MAVLVKSESGAMRTCAVAIRNTQGTGWQPAAMQQRNAQGTGWVAVYVPGVNTPIPPGDPNNPPI